MSSTSTDRVELKTERLVLRPFGLGDVDDMVAMGGFPTWDGSGPTKPYTRRHAEEMLAQRVLDTWDTKPGFAVVLDGTVVGVVGMNINPAHETAEIGYSLQEKHWGKGITSEAVRAVLSWALRDRGLAKVAAEADVRNERSWRLMEKVGMTRDGISRSDHVIHGVRTGMVWYSILREEMDHLVGTGTPSDDYDGNSGRREEGG
jgi:ribosomal-protein-alanine N-acetyltransferase